MSEHNASRSIAVVAPNFAPDKYALFRKDSDRPGKTYAWCGRSLGWCLLGGVSDIFYRYYDSVDAALEASDELIRISLPKETAHA